MLLAPYKLIIMAVHGLHWKLLNGMLWVGLICLGSCSDVIGLYREESFGQKLGKKFMRILINP